MPALSAVASAAWIASSSAPTWSSSMTALPSSHSSTATAVRIGSADRSTPITRTSTGYAVPVEDGRDLLTVCHTFGRAIRRSAWLTAPRRSSVKAN